jgi:hypothetical protein
MNQRLVTELAEPGAPQNFDNDEAKIPINGILECDESCVKWTKFICSTIGNWKLPRLFIEATAISTPLTHPI